MPESVTDRCTKSHEYIFLLTKNKKYYYDNDAIREPHTWEESKPRPSGMERNAQKYRSKVNYGGGGSGFAGHSGSLKADGTSLNHPDGRNKRSVWTVTTKPFKDAHFATFPPELIKPCILAGCPEDGIVLDPFGGAGTTGVVANRCDRNAILIELNDEYAEMSRKRIYNDAPLFVDVE
jgi:DNA modification methylase